MRRDASQLIDLLHLDRESNAPLHRQIFEYLRDLILENRLKAHTPLPATRALAGDLGVSRNTVIAAYDALLTEGYLESRVGSGTRVAKLSNEAMCKREGDVVKRPPPLSKRGELMTTQPRDPMIPGRIGFHPGFPETDSFPFSTWSRLLRKHARYPKEDLFGYHSIAGHPQLKLAIANYMQVSRGVNCKPDQVIVVSGAQAALDLVGRLLMDEGDFFWVEEPGYLGAHTAFSSAGGLSVPIGVGSRGWALDSEFRPPPRLIFVTPSCQWPTGLIMRADERLRLLQLAEHHDAWIIEDDYGSEYRLHGRPVPVTQGLDHSGRVIYVGTFAKTLFPSLRIGFIIVPQQLVEGFKRAVNVTGQNPPLLLQAVLADFIGEGYYSAHIRRMRRLYSGRKKKFIVLCSEILGEWFEFDKTNVGMHLVGRLRGELNDGKLHEAALGLGVDFSRLSVQYHHYPPVQGAMLGFAGVPELDVEPGVALLREAIESILA